MLSCRAFIKNHKVFIQESRESLNGKNRQQEIG